MASMIGTNAATWGIAALATMGVIARPWNLPEFIWAIAGAALLVIGSLAARLLDRGHAVGHASAPVALFFEAIPEQFTQVGFVFNDKD